MRRIFLIAASISVGSLAHGEDLVSSDHTAIFPADRAAELVSSVCYKPPSEITGYWTPREADLTGIEDNLDAYLRTVERPSEKELMTGQRRTIHWDWRYRQVAGITRGDHKLLFLSYFSPGPPEMRAAMEAARRQAIEREGGTYDPERWKKTPVVIADGGSGFFRVLFDLTTRTFVWYEQNGSA